MTYRSNCAGFAKLVFWAEILLKVILEGDVIKYAHNNAISLSFYNKYILLLQLLFLLHLILLLLFVFLGCK